MEQLRHDLVISGAEAVLVSAEDAVPHGWVAVDDGAISAVGTGSAPPADATLDASGGIVLPGFVSAHQHTADTLLRGVRPFAASRVDWLVGQYYAGTLTMRPDDVAVAARLASWESLSSGVTSMTDLWGIGNGADAGWVRECWDAAAGALASSGQRVLLARMVADRMPADLAAAAAPAAMVEETRAALTSARELAQRWDGTGLLQVTLAPELPEMASDELLIEAAALARELKRPLHLHLPAGGQTERLERLGVLGPDLVVVHGCTLDADDIARLAAADVALVHCPTSNAALGGAITPVRALLTAGVRLGLGADNGTLHGSGDVLGEARRAVLDARSRESDPLALATEDALTMATGDATLAAGTAADVVVLDATGPRWWPRQHWATAVVLQGRASDVRHVVVAGECRVRDGNVLGVDAAELRASAQAAGERLARHHSTPAD